MWRLSVLRGRPIFGGAVNRGFTVISRFHVFMSNVHSHITLQLAYNNYFVDVDGNGEIKVKEDGEEQTLSLSVVDIVVFTTGAAQIPPMGFAARPFIVFKDAAYSTSDLPSASTCSNTLYIPTVHYNDYETFRYKFVFAVTCAIGFGKV